MLTLTSAAILSIANPSTVSCGEETKTTHRHINNTQRRTYSDYTESKWIWYLIYFTVLLIWSVFISIRVLHSFHLDESWYEEAALVTVMKFFPVVLNKFPSSFASLFAASSDAPDYRHSVLGTNLLLKIPQPESVSLFTRSLKMFNSYSLRSERVRLDFLWEC